MKSIGGYFELELNNKKEYHPDALKFNTGRNALEYILIVNRYSKIFLPYYTCDVILEPVKRLNLKYEFYSIDEDFEPKELPDNFKKNEALLYINYFGLKSNFIAQLAQRINNLIIDNSQAFFEFPIPGIDSFYSPRKFFGLPDGGLAYVNRNNTFNIEKLNYDKSIGRLLHLFTRIEEGPEAGFHLFRENEKRLSNLPLMRMSIITERLLRNIDYQNSLKIRNINFYFLHNHLKEFNDLSSVIDNTTINGHMVYPYLKAGNDRLREELIRNKIYVATYWPNVLKLKRSISMELYLAKNLLPLPIDQRYNKSDLKYILDTIKKYA
jgi:hypothetical protein